LQPLTPHFPHIRIDSHRCSAWIRRWQRKHSTRPRLEGSNGNQFWWF
jgi:hypothetical protein